MAGTLPHRGLGDPVREGEEKRLTVREPRAVGTPLDLEPETHRTPLPGVREGAIVFAIAFVAYFAIGYWFTIDRQGVAFPALDRLTRALLVWQKAPPKRATIASVFPPLSTAMFLPFAAIKPI